MRTTRWAVLSSLLFAAVATAAVHVHYFVESGDRWGWCGLKQVRKMCCSCGSCYTPCSDEK